MNTLSERRKSKRITLSSIEYFFRQCDIAASTGKGELDITILDISPQGMKLRIDLEEDRSKITPRDEIFIRGCIFNDSIGFLSSQKAVAVWTDEAFCGIRFTPELELNETDLLEMLI